MIKLSLKLYHPSELQLDYQQFRLIAEAPAVGPGVGLGRAALAAGE
jgi:hypothetical protein